SGGGEAGLRRSRARRSAQAMPPTAATTAAAQGSRQTGRIMARISSRRGGARWTPGCNARRPAPMRRHKPGICRTCLGGRALVARAAGDRVPGCDASVYPPMSTQLAEQGIELIEGYEAGQMALRPDLYVVGNVVTRGNPLMEAILDSGARYVSGPQWLGDNVLPGAHVLAVAGTHGKTTTSSMLAWILEAAGLRPNFLIGGVAHDLKVSARYDP